MDKVRIEINRSTRDALKDVGNMGDTYDILLCKMIDTYKVYIEFVSKRNDTSTDQPGDT